jgi:hypothetical protein
VLPACEQAVSLAPDQGYILDSRGLARALTDDTVGPIEDFQFYIQWAQQPENLEFHSDDATLRESWIQALQAGQNPFDKETLEALRQDSCYFLFRTAATDNDE